jgi:broad specificity phosphatase PhoE
MKKVYFVRHGESESNAGLLRSTVEVPLTLKGRGQAEFIAERVSKLPVEVIISSTMTRARETAEVIGEKTLKDIEFSNLFTEARAASEVQGKPRDSEETVRISNLFFENFGKPDWRYSDEENFFDLKDRARNALAYLAARPEENIAVVTHGFFMRIVIAYAMFGEELTAKECQQFTRLFHMENTGLSVLGYDPEKNESWPWWLWVWNDHAHLG